MEHRQTSQKEFQIIDVATLPSRMWGITPHPLSAGCAHGLPSKGNSRGRGRKRNLMVGKPDKPQPGGQG